MNNSKTGALIRELRLAQNMTQKDLADQLHITDRAVSKWERGLCAPDIALLEPLAQALGCTVLELLEGQRAQHSPEQAETARMVMDYSRQEIKKQVHKAHWRSFIFILLAVSPALLAGVSWLFNSGILYVDARFPSPDGQTAVTLYDRDFSGAFFRFSLFNKDGCSFDMRYPNGSQGHYSYDADACEGLWWTPDSSKYVIVLRNGEEHTLLYYCQHGDINRDLSYWISEGFSHSQLPQSFSTLTIDWENDVDYQFLQWSRDSQSMLLYYSFFDQTQQLHDGYFWYNCVTRQVSGVLELDR